MAVLAKVGTLRAQRFSRPKPLLAHQALAALRSLCTEGCVRTVRSTCVGVRSVIREYNMDRSYSAEYNMCAHNVCCTRRMLVNYYNCDYRRSI